LAILNTRRMMRSMQNYFRYRYNLEVRNDEVS
jgi:hypothetical protein